MFLKNAIRDNPAMIEAAVRLHQGGEIPPNTWLLDLDMIAANAEIIAREAKKLNLNTYFMSKQLNRNPMAALVALKKGLNKVVAVDTMCAKILHRYEIPVGHVGHLSQIPRGDIEAILRLKPEVATVYSYESAEMFSRAASKMGLVQDLLIKVVDHKDLFFPGQESGIWLDELAVTAKRINSLPGIRIVGVTAFPCVKYNIWGTEGIEATPNFATLLEGAEILPLIPKVSSTVRSL